MKNFKRILCFLLMFVTIGFFTACSKGETPPSGGDDSGFSQGGGESGGGSSGTGPSEPGGSGDENEPEEVYVPYSSSEIMMVGSNFVDAYFDEFEADTSDENLFDDNINEMKVLFLNASKMLKYVSQMEDLTFGACMKGFDLTVDDDYEKPNAVAKFYVTYNEENSDGDASVRIRILFSYKELDVKYNYDYYDILIETNKAQKLVSCDFSVEKAIQKTGLEDSTARYYVFDINGNIDGGNNFEEFNIYQFDRTEQIEAQTSIDFNVIDDFEQSRFVSEIETYVGGENAELLLRNSSSEQSLMLSQRIGNLGQGLKKLSGGVFGTISGLSEALVVYVDLDTEII